MNARVKRPARLLAYIIGILGAIIMGSGMSLVMTDLGAAFGLNKDKAMLSGTIVGVIGTALICTAYPMYNRIKKKERERIAHRRVNLLGTHAGTKTVPRTVFLASLVPCSILAV